MKHSEERNVSPDIILGLTRRYQATADNDERGRLLEEILSYFFQYSRSRQRKLKYTDFEEFEQYVMTKFWEFDYIGKYDFVSSGIKTYIMTCINFCGLNMHTAENRRRNKFNNTVDSIYEKVRTASGQPLVRADIIADDTQNPEETALNAVEHQNRIEFLKSIRTKFHAPRRKRAIDVLIKNPSFRLIDVARAVKCSAETARQLFLQVRQMAAAR